MGKNFRIMKAEVFKTEALQKTLPLMDVPVENWQTFNDRLNTYIVDNSHPMETNVKLAENELPILECILEDSFVLITTEHVVSGDFAHYEQVLLKEILGFTNDFEKDNFKMVGGILPKIHVMVLKVEGNRRLLLKVDSYHPAYFVKVLITNLSYFKKHGKWFWNPQSRL